jgi:hypothetical protein
MTPRRTLSALSSQRQSAAGKKPQANRGINGEEQ